MPTQYRTASRIPLSLIMLAILGVAALGFALFSRSSPPILKQKPIGVHIFPKIAADLAAPVQIADSTLEQDVRMVADDLAQRPRQAAVSKTVLLFLDSKAGEATADN